MNGTDVARNASRSAMLVCVKAPGLMITNAIPSLLAPCTLPISSCSALLWQVSKSWPFARARTPSFDSISRSVAEPYSAGSRVPSRFKFGPFRSKIRAIWLLIQRYRAE